MAERVAAPPLARPRGAALTRGRRRATGALLAPLYPLDRTRNGTQSRRVVADVASTPRTAAAIASPSTITEMGPLLRQLITAYDRAGLPPAYVRKDQS